MIVSRRRDLALTVVTETRLGGPRPVIEICAGCHRVIEIGTGVRKLSLKLGQGPISVTSVNPILVSMTSFRPPVPISMTSLGHPAMILIVIIGMRILKEKLMIKG